jgi:type I restriction enzyme S subunit
MSEKVKFKDITINLDKQRKPLNGIDRNKISIKKMYPYCGANNIMDYVDEYLFDEEILCIAEDGGKWGKNEICSYIMNEKCWVNNHAHVIKVKETVDIRYLKYWLNYTDLNSSITGAIVRKLTQKELNELEIIIPKKEEQLIVADKLDKVQSIINIKKKQIDMLNELIKSQFVNVIHFLKLNISGGVLWNI